MANMPPGPAVMPEAAAEKPEFRKVLARVESATAVGDRAPVSREGDSYDAPPDQTGASPASPAVARRESFFGRIVRGVGLWFDKTVHSYSDEEQADIYATDVVRMVPYLAVHLMCFGVIWVGWSWVAVGVAAALYAVHMFAITGFFHRYFSHRTFKTSRWFQFVMAVVGNSCVQRGPIWWAARHRHHHRHSDEACDIHSPSHHGFYWAHVGWITSKRAFAVDEKSVPDLMKYPELRFLDRFDMLIPILEAVALFFFGMFLQARGWNTSGGQMLIWGFFISIVVSSHATFTINSLTHMWGKARYKTSDDSRNSLLLALLTFGEGWHNNHHYYPGATRQGFFWWEIDLTYYGLRLLSALGLIWDLNPVPEKVRASSRLVDEPRPKSGAADSTR